MESNSKKQFDTIQVTDKNESLALPLYKIPHKQNNHTIKQSQSQNNVSHLKSESEDEDDEFYGQDWNHENSNKKLAKDSEPVKQTSTDKRKLKNHKHL